MAFRALAAFSRKKTRLLAGAFEWIQAMAKVVGLRGGDLVAVGVLGSMRFG